MELGGKYIGHFTPIKGRCCSILEGIVKFSEDNEVSMESKVAIRCDGTLILELMEAYSSIDGIV